mmetsp:Transcript_504/g.1029  ORF Transcript_504/g.1029 Transcript_504/m.1029 type:complete len:142 (-) Transcript_504:29-454(-)
MTQNASQSSPRLLPLDLFLIINSILLKRTVIANSKRPTHQLVPAIKSKQDRNDIKCDVIHIHGSLDKNEIFKLTNILCSKITVNRFNPRAIVVTSAADLGIDHEEAIPIVNNEIPDYPGTAVQRLGRASRMGKLSTFILVA